VCRPYRPQRPMTTSVAPVAIEKIFVVWSAPGTLLLPLAFQGVSDLLDNTVPELTIPSFPNEPVSIGASADISDYRVDWSRGSVVFPAPQ
jgi:hypothetical protein